MKKLRSCFHSGVAETCEQCIRRRSHKRDKERGRRERQRLSIFAEHGNRCVFCGTTENLTIDHIVPLSRGGSNARENRQPACRSCNSRKGSRKTWSFPPRREESSGL